MGNLVRGRERDMNLSENDKKGIEGNKQINQETKNEQKELLT